MFVVFVNNAAEPTLPIFSENVYPDEKSMSVPLRSKSHISNAGRSAVDL
jgi:hypothetical protein